MKRSIVMLACAGLALAGTAAAHDAAPASNMGAAIRAEFKKNLADTQDKILKLAKATPAEKYSWRPAEGVRSVSEVYMHIVGGNYFLPSFTGTAGKMPEWLTRDAEKTITDKAKVTEALEASFAHLNAALDAATDDKLDVKVKTFLGEQSVREVYLLAVTHAHEHLGQSIAYARMNGIAPPWSEGAAPPAKKDASTAEAKDGK